MSRDDLIPVYTICIRPLLEYCAPVFLAGQTTKDESAAWEADAEESQPQTNATTHKIISKWTVNSQYDDAPAFLLQCSSTEIGRATYDDVDK